MGGGKGNRKKIMVTIKPLGSSGAPHGGMAGPTATVLKSAVANLTLDSPPLMDLNTPANERRVAAPQVAAAQASSPIPTPPKFEESPAQEPGPRRGDPFDPSDSSSSDDDEGGFMGGGRRKKLAIKIRPASEASTAPALAANKDISAVVASLRGSIEGLPAASSGPERPEPAQDSATRFQQGMASLQHGRWQDAILELDSALALMASDMAALGKHWPVVVHHRVFAGIMLRCDGTNVSEQPSANAFRRNLLLCARRLRLQSVLGIRTTLSAAQALVRTREYKAAHALLQGTLGVLPRYSQTAHLAPKVAQMRDVCAVKLDQGVETVEDPFLAKIAETLGGVRSTGEVSEVLDKIFAQAEAGA